MSQVLDLVFMPDGRVVNETNADPAIPRVTGYQNYWVAADLGQANDNSAVVVIKDEALPIVDVVDHLIRLKNAPPFGGKSHLVIDGTSIGRVVSDMLHAQNVPHYAIQMTAGQDWSKKNRYVNASKTLMVENLAVMFAAGEIKFAHDLPLRAEIEADLASFTTQTTAAGNSIIAQSRSASGHGDLGIALIVGGFASQYLKPQRFETYQLRGYYG